MRFVHTADWQLGMTRHFLEGEAQPRYSAARRDAVAGLGALAAQASAEFVVVAGDVFEHNQLAPKVISQSLEAMRAIGVPVYLLPGNHDPLDASSVYTSALFKAECPDNVDRAGPRRSLGCAPRCATRRRAVALEGTDHRPGGRGAGRSARRRHHPHPRRPRRRRRARPGSRQAVADPDGRAVRRHRPRGGPLCRVGGQALSHVRRRQRTGLVLGVARGDQFRRRRGRPGARPGGRRRRGRPGPPGDRRESHHVGRWRFVTLHRQVDDSRDIADLDLNLDLLADKERTSCGSG